MSKIIEFVKPRLRGVVSALVWALTGPLDWLRFFRTDVWIVEGEEQTSRLPLSILCAVRVGASRNYVLDLIFGSSYRQRHFGRCWLWNLAKAVSAAASDCSMIIVLSDESHLKFARADDWFLIPCWLMGEVEIPYEPGVAGKFTRELRRRIRRGAFEVEVARESQQFDDFYHNMYVPHITRTFGKSTDLACYNDLKAIFRDCGELLLLKNQEGFIGGQLIHYDKAGPHLREMGIRDANRDHVRDGAASALNHFCLKHLEEKGYKKAQLGWSRAFLNDGVLQFKKNWSQRIVHRSHVGFALRILAHTPASRAFLCNNPFIFTRHDDFYSAIFVDVDKPLNSREIQQIDREYFQLGLSRLFICCLNETHALTPNLVPTEFLEHIELRGARDVPGGSDGTRLTGAASEISRPVLRA